MADIEYIDEDHAEVLKVQNGDNSAFDILIYRHQERIARQMRRFSTNQHIIEELTQTVFVNAYQSIDNYEPKAPFIHWLRTIASRVGYKFWSDETKTPKTVSLEEWDQKPETSPRKYGHDPGAVLEEVLSRIPPKERQVLCMMHLDNMSTKEIAETMDWTVAMVKMRAYRSRKKLRKLFNDNELGELLDEYR